MANIKEVELIDILPKLPNIESLDIIHDLSNKTDHLFLCALGFEDRCTWIPEIIFNMGCYNSQKGVCFEYKTNISDNNKNKLRLSNALRKFCKSVDTMQCDQDDFTERLRPLLKEACNVSENPRISFDISVCSSKLILLTLKVLFEFDLDLRILYSEAGIYHPTHDEYKENSEKWTTEKGFGLAKGVSRVIPSSEHPGNRRDRLPEAVVVFPTFKPERTKAIITYVDESLITRPRDRIIWIIGNPHLPEDHWRADIIKEINTIQDTEHVYEVTTFNYRKTLEALEKIYHFWDCKYHITISPLGSKFQSLAIALFWQMRQDISIVFATPKEYNAFQYSNGCKAIWQINFGNLKKIRDILNCVGQLEIIN